MSITHKRSSSESDVFTECVQQTAGFEENTSAELNDVDCVDCLQTIAASALAALEERESEHERTVSDLRSALEHLTTLHKRARHDRARYWDERNTAREHLSLTRAQLTGEAPTSTDWGTVVISKSDLAEGVLAALRCTATPTS